MAPMLSFRTYSENHQLTLPSVPPPSTKWMMGACECCSDKPLCLYTALCPCLAFKEAAENMGSHRGWIHCLLTFPLGLHCCVLTSLGNQAAETRGIDHGMSKSACRSLLAPCNCYACTVVNESRYIKMKNASRKVKFTNDLETINEARSFREQQKMERS